MDYKWICHTHILKDDEYECPICGFVTDMPYRTCPGCGSQMNEKNSDLNWIDEIEIIDAVIDD